MYLKILKEKVANLYFLLLNEEFIHYLSNFNKKLLVDHRCFGSMVKHNHLGVNNMD